MGPRLPFSNIPKTMELHLLQNDQQTGPYSLDQIAAMLQNGEINQDTPAWHEGLSEWTLLSELVDIETIREPEAILAAPNPSQGSAPESFAPNAPRWFQLRKVQYAAAALVVALLALFLWPEGDRAKQLANRIEALDEAISANMDNPEKAVNRMIQLFEKEGPETVKLVMELGIELASIEDKGDRKDRIKEVQEVLETPIKNLMETMEEFEEVAGDDRDAQRVMEEYMMEWYQLGNQLQESLMTSNSFKQGSDRSAVIMNIRNCQQAMRGHQNMRNLNPGDPFTRAGLEEYLKFPEDIKVDGGWIRFEAGDKITPEGGNPPVNDDHIWLKVSGPGMDGIIGDYGFDDLSDVAGW